MTGSDVTSMGVGSWIVLGILLLFVLYIWYRIFEKAGYSGWFALLMVIPLVNFIVLIYFAFSEWPVQRQINVLKSTSSPSSTRVNTGVDLNKHR
jgi:uncharacterized membrane protein YhaH (DUF805 family)